MKEENNIPTVKISEIHEHCKNIVTGVECGAITKWEELFRCCKCGKFFNKPDVAFYTFAVLSVLETNSKIKVSAPYHFRDKLESVLGYFKNIGILKEISRKTKTIEQKENETGKKINVDIIEVELQKLGVLEAHRP